MLRNWLLRAFGAGSIGEIWQYWNPVYGYVLGYFVYRPLRRFVPRPIAVWLSFVVCGLALHDLVGWTLARQVRFPEMSLLFALFGAEVVLADYLHLELSSRPLFVRLAVNGGWLLGAWAIARLAVAG
jgi:hypothetical protein